jgi:hypothetical protein
VWHLSHFETILFQPLEMREAKFIRMRGKARPPGEARYFGSHSGANFTFEGVRPSAPYALEGGESEEMRH